jgi:hypothetical protein
LISPASSRPAGPTPTISALGGRQRLVSSPDLGSRGGDVGLLELGRERIRRAGGEHQVVRLEHIIRCQRDAAPIDRDGAIADEAAVGEQGS